MTRRIRRILLPGLNAPVFNMTQCCVPGCFNQSGSKQQSNLSFYRFPCEKREKRKIENEKLKKQVEKQKQTFSFSQISDNPERVQYYTGLPDAASVLFLEALLSRFDLKYHSDWTVQMMPLIDQLFLTLIKLKLNFGHEDLSIRFNCSRGTVIAKNQTSLPDCFQPFPNCRIVLDCTEVSVCNTERLDTQSHLYSQYKGRTTLKALIGVAPNGVITFVSNLYGGSASDKAITADCGVLQHLQPGDMVIADKGFTIRDILPEGEEVNNNRKISCARIHVERSIQRLKVFSILHHIPYQLKKNINKILKACVCLTNLQTPILREIE
uniref:DDE Tnp4 domain-containing protein n=1 Tax=Astatotilapia calliptera TaxID=8154 RepID=A0AAX7SFJ0_ASTCA